MFKKEIKALREQFDLEMASLETDMWMYPDMFRDDLKRYLRMTGILPSKVYGLLPSSDLVEKDYYHLMGLCRYYRIDFGLCTGLASFEYFVSMQEDAELKEVPVEAYIVRQGGLKIKHPIKFTKEEFIESVKQGQEVKVLRKDFPTES